MVGAEVVALQLSAIIDHVCIVNDAVVAQVVGMAEMGGARRCSAEELECLLGMLPGATHVLNNGTSA